MGSKRYGEEMSKIVRFTPKGQTTMEGIYSQLDKNKTEDRNSGISEENTTKAVFGQEKFYIRPTDEDYGDEVKKVKKTKKTQSTKPSQDVGFGKSPKRKSAKPSVKKKEVERRKNPNASKVVAKERRKAILDAVKPSREHRRVVLIVVVMAALLCMFVSFFYVSSKISSTQYENLELKKQYENKLYEKKELETKLESSNRSDLIETIAREQLGMNYPRPDQIVYIKSN